MAAIERIIGGGDPVDPSVSGTPCTFFRDAAVAGHEPRPDQAGEEGGGLVSVESGLHGRKVGLYMNGDFDSEPFSP